MRQRVLSYGCYRTGTPSLPKGSQTYIHIYVVLQSTAPHSGHSMQPRKHRSGNTNMYFLGGGGVWKGSKYEKTNDLYIQCGAKRPKVHRVQVGRAEGFMRQKVRIDKRCEVFTPLWHSIECWLESMGGIFVGDYDFEVWEYWFRTSACTKQKHGIWQKCVEGSRFFLMMFALWEGVCKDLLNTFRELEVKRGGSSGKTDYRSSQRAVGFHLSDQFKSISSTFYVSLHPSATVTQNHSKW